FGVLFLELGILIGQGNASAQGLAIFHELIDILRNPRFWRVLVDLISILVWPLVVILAICVFKKEIGSLVPRVQEVSATGIKIGPAEQQKAAIAPSPDPTSTIQALPLPSAEVATVESNIRQSLVGTEGQKREESLIRRLATTTLAA